MTHLSEKPPKMLSPRGKSREKALPSGEGGRATARSGEVGERYRLTAMAFFAKCHLIRQKSKIFATFPNGEGFGASKAPPPTVFFPLRHGVRRATSPKGRGKTSSVTAPYGGVHIVLGERSKANVSCETLRKEQDPSTLSRNLREKFNFYSLKNITFPPAEPGEQVISFLREQN